MATSKPFIPHWKQCNRFRINFSRQCITGVLCERLKSLVKTLIGPYQCGVRSHSKENLRKISGYNYIFVDCKGERACFCNNVWTLGIPAELISLCRMALSNSCSSIKVRIDLSEAFYTVQDKPITRSESSCCYTLTTLTSQGVPSKVLQLLSVLLNRSLCKWV